MKGVHNGRVAQRNETLVRSSSSRRCVRRRPPFLEAEVYPVALP